MFVPVAITSPAFIVVIHVMNSTVSSTGPAHVARVVVLSHLAVDPQLDVQVLSVLNLVCSDESPDRGGRRCPRTFPKRSCCRRWGSRPRRHVHKIQIAENVTGCLLRRHVRRRLADHETKLSFVVEMGNRRVGKLYRVPVANDCARRLQERLPVSRERQLAVLEIVARHAAMRVGSGSGALRRTSEIGTPSELAAASSSLPCSRQSSRSAHASTSARRYAVYPQSRPTRPPTLSPFRTPGVKSLNSTSLMHVSPLHFWFISRADCSTGPRKPSKRQSNCTAPLTGLRHGNTATSPTKSIPDLWAQTITSFDCDAVRVAIQD